MSTPFPRYTYIISKYPFPPLLPLPLPLPLQPQHLTHLLSRRLDPLFALFIGLSAAGLRIRREEREKGETGEMGDIVGKMWRRGWGWGWGQGEFALKGVEEKGGDI